ncbi:DUF3600 domain-containing protein [Ammoniphilus sp. YIM 78166]|uniref:DUF3600 domain-containing protein n=1 Tax=Ammoniphilus sp. YIM 78166 TaxID=1644106 RepID=UPI00106F2932|nr:DUF3600 domain-containing protein [Ammoniphilus sp. YIM 78166]
MSINHQIRQALQWEAERVQPKPEMKERVLQNIDFSSPTGKWKRRLVPTVLATCLLLPTAAFAGYTYLSDKVWGSVENLERVGGTQEDYQHFESKLVHAQATLGPKEFAQFLLLLKDLTYYNIKMADLKGNLHPEKLNPEDKVAYERLLTQIQPYFDKLNEALSSGK